MDNFLTISGLSCGYGDAVVLTDITLVLKPGESLALLGRNGTGKTTLLNTLVGAVQLKSSRRTGKIIINGREIQDLPAHHRAAAGLGWVPQERNIFKSLTVEENLTAVARPGPWTVRHAYEMFPRLEERRNNLGTQLSGGEQQMLAIARALVLNPTLILLDEPLEGLAPILVEELLASIQKMALEGLSLIIVEQHPHHVLGITQKAVVLDKGGIAYKNDSSVLVDAPTLLDPWLGVSRTTATQNS